jgi:hypothetical protein
MSLDKVREAKERGWKAVLVEDPDKQDPEGGGTLSFYALLTPSGKPIEVSGRDGYGSTWGDFTEPEAWDRLPDEL